MMKFSLCSSLNSKLGTFVVTCPCRRRCSQVPVDSNTTTAKVASVVKSYYAARIASNRPIKSHDSALFRAAEDKQADIKAIFGGQGNTEDYFDELVEIYNIYGELIIDVFQLLSDTLLNLSRTHKDAKKVFFKGLNVMEWIKNSDATPDIDYLISAPVSVPLIGFIQFAHFAAVAKVLGKTPGDLKAYFSGTTGHSQGLITAMVIAASDSWESFNQEVVKGITLLFYIGLYSQREYPFTSLAPSILEDSVAEGEGKPSPMLSVRDLTKEQLESFIDATNKHLPKEKHINISLINGGRNMVVTGPPQSLYGLNLTLRKAKAPSDSTRAEPPLSAQAPHYQ